MRPPDFWYDQKGSLLSALIAPAGWIYGLASAIRQDRTSPWHAPIPVICIGNLVAGGQGKTPTAIAIGTILKAKGKAVHFISRGYGGSLEGPVQVNIESHSSHEVGDEPLLLAEIGPTWVAANRAVGIQAAHETGAEIIILDDGFQNPSVHKDISIIVIDGEMGFGNGRLIPAGPLREGVTVGLNRAEAVLIIGEDRFNIAKLVDNVAREPLKILKANLKPGPSANDLKDQKVFGFAGIGRPKKFFNTLLEIGCDVVGAKAFDDHHPYTEAEVSSLRTAAESEDARLVTTTKDYVRLPSALKKDVSTVSVTLDWTDESALDSLLNPLL